ncbi:hypothetical protein YC2023_071401 [Brassica napus]
MIFMDFYDSKLNDMEIENKSNKKDRKMDDGIFVAGRVSLSTRISGWLDD